MKVTISPACLRDISYIGAHMREHDQREILCQFPDDTTPQQAALTAFAASLPDTAFVAYLDKTPVGAYGLAPTSLPTLWSAWAFGTADLRRVIPAISRHGMTRFFPTFFKSYRPKRVEIRSIGDHDLAHQWLTGMGATKEADLPRYGRNGEDFVLFAWTDKTIWTIYENWQRKHTRQRQKAAA